MNQREGFGRIAKAAFIASMIGASLFAVAIALFTVLPAENDAQASDALGLALVAFPLGWVIAALTAWPVGTVIGWLLSRTGPSTSARAAASGGLTGFVLIATIVVLGSDFPRDAGPTEWLYLAGFMLLGAISGWLAYRWVLRPAPVSK